MTGTNSSIFCSFLIWLYSELSAEHQALVRLNYDLDEITETCPGPQIYCVEKTLEK